jgi:hypothetical protein
VADIWTQNTGYDLGMYSERDRVEIPLPINSDIPANINFKLISGKLPAGLRLENNMILGTPFEVPRTTTYKFVIRAAGFNILSDRTFTMSVAGADEPNWLTPAGALPVGTNKAYYIIDSSFIDFQLSATDTDTAAGQKLNFFIASGEGELPPGLILLPNGRITGFIQPLLAIPRERVSGNYDMQLYDSYGYDFGNRSTNGYDSFVYDLVTYDFNIDQTFHRKLNRNYEFIATITDGDTITKRKFRIYVVGDDFFRADNVIMRAGQGTYTADVTYVRAPLFTTPNYLGLRRANNYQTFKIDIFEGFYNELGPVIYDISPVNSLINGLIEKELTTDNKVGSTTLRFVKSSGVPQIGWKFNFFQEFREATNKTYTITEVDALGADFYRITIDQPLDYTIPNGFVIYIGNESRLPPGMDFDKVTGEVFGIVPYQPAITETYRFTIKATRFGTVLGRQVRYENGREISESSYFETATSRRMFTVDILGEVESNINWNTSRELGTIDVGYPSTLFVNASTTYSNSTIFYTLEKGKLPPGLQLNLDGEIVGKINQLREQNTYRSYWKPNIQYNLRDIVKQNVERNIVSVTRRRNIATLVTDTPHGFKNNSIIKIKSNALDYNYYSGVEINVDQFKILDVTNITGNGPYYVTFSIPSQQLEPLAPLYTLVKGTSATTGPLSERIVEDRSKPVGSRARFLISKGTNGFLNYNGLINTPSHPITLVDPGQGYKPGDTITISGSQLNGVDGINDLTFKLVNSLNYEYKISGNSNPLYNGTFYSVSSKQKVKTLIGSQISILVSSITDNLVTVETTTSHNLKSGDFVEITNSIPTSYNGIYQVNVISPTSFTYSIRNSNVGSMSVNGVIQKIEYNDSITLLYNVDPGTFGTGLISVEVGRALFESQTQMLALTYFRYTDFGNTELMKTITGKVISDPVYYRYKSNLNAPLGTPTSNTEYWEKFDINNKDSTVTTIDKNNTYFDGETTDFDKTYKFTVKARDQLNYSAVSREFVINVNIPGNTYYSNIRAQPFLKQIQREWMKEFLNNRNIFDPRYIYRLGDSNFGVQRNLSTLIYAGIETRQAVEYISAMGRNHKPKRFKLGEIKKAVAKEPGTNRVIYEVVYIDLIDPLEKNGKHLPFKIATMPAPLNVTVDNTNEFYDGPFTTDNPYWKRPIPFNSTIDRNDIIAGDSGTGVKFPSSISIWRKRLRQIETARRERNYLPLWMRSIQPGSYVELDYVPAVVLCYCKPGGADEIILNIKNNGFDFKLLDYTIDRYIIDSVDGYYEDKYLVFRNDRTTIV